MRHFIFFCLLLSGLPSIAQTDSGSVVVHKDPRIELLINKQIEINEYTTRNSRRNVQGFRILVINTNDRAKATEAKARIYQKFRELPAYLMYQSPFYKLKVGNFREREEAEQYLVDIQRLFPNGVFVVRDVIEVKPD